MTSEQKQFENKWKDAIVKPKGLYYQIPIKKYKVTTALYKWENGETIFAIMSEDWSLKNPEWFTIRIGSEELDERLKDFEIIYD